MRLQCKRCSGPCELKSRRMLLAWLKRYKRPVAIITSLVVLQIAFGFDPKFCIINLVWLLV